VVHYGHPGAVHSVMVDGEFLLRDRKMLALDEQALMDEAQRVARRVWEGMISKNPDIPPPPGGLRWLDI
jgi:5-methylthioadenosine/S-adenosylhomocysteine deaminase